MTAVLATRGIGYDPGANDWEREMDRWFDQSGLPPARRQYRVQVEGHRYKLDRAIPALKVGIEWNGRESHGTRSQFEYDSDRRNRLQAAGWRILDFHYRSDPELIVRTVLAVCEEQRRLGPSPGRTDPVDPAGADRTDRADGPDRADRADRPDHTDHTDRAKPTTASSPAEN